MRQFQFRRGLVLRGLVLAGLGVLSGLSQAGAQGTVVSTAPAAQALSPISIIPHADFSFTTAYPGSVPIPIPWNTSAGSKGNSISITGGADALFGSTFLLGAGFSHGDTRFKNTSNGDKSESTSDIAFVRGVWYFRQKYNASLTLGHGSVAGNSTVFVGTTPNLSKSDGHSSYISAQLGATFESGAWVLSPTLSITQSKTTTEGFNISLGAPTGESKDTVGRVSAGSELGYRIGIGSGATLTPSVRAQFVYDYDTSVSNRDRNALDLAAGATLSIGALSLRGEYFGTYYREPDTTHGGRISASWRF